MNSPAIASTFLLTVLTSGCVWQTKQNAYCIGPFFERIGGTQSNICQTIYFPCNLTLGRQCDLAVGWRKQTATLATAMPPNGWQIHFWLVLPLPDVPVFYHDQFLGVRLQGGVAQTGFMAGYASSLVIRPEADGFYYISFDSIRPMASEFHYWREVPPTLPPSFQPKKQTHE